MRSVSVLRLAALAALLLELGCADTAMRARVADLSKRVDTLEQRNHELEQAALVNAQQGDATRRRLAIIDEFISPWMNKKEADEPNEPPEPDPIAVYAVPIDGDAYEGAAAAPVTIVVAFDFMCPYCRKLVGTLDEVKQRYGSKVRVVYKHFVVHPKTATAPALAACAAARQGKFSEMAGLLWTRGFDHGGYSPELLDQLVHELGLDRKRYDADVTECHDRLTADYSALERLGVNGTPAAYINGRYIGGAQPVDTFVTLIDEELGKAEARLKAGTRVEDYYGKYVLAAGRTEL